MQDHRIPARHCFRLDVKLAATGNNQQRALGTRLLEHHAHQGVEQCLEDHFARHGF